LKMNKFNEKCQVFCKYCGKEYYSLNSLKQHEARCKQNKNRIISTKHPKRGKYKNNGYKWMNNNLVNKFVHPKDFDFYKNLGWKFGMNNTFKKKISQSLLSTDKEFGRCLDPIKEKERREKISNSMKGNKNWQFNKKRGNGKKGWFKEIFCDSSWELAFLVYHIEHNLNIQRCKTKYKYVLDGNTHTYTPDFITDEGVIEIKGRKDKKALVKEQNFPEIKIIGADKIKPYLDYVINKYGLEFWKILYNNND